MDQAVQKRAGGENRGAGAHAPPVAEHDGADAALVEFEIRRVALDHREVRLRPHRLLHGGAVELSVGLGAGTAHCGALGAVQEAELDAAPVGGLAHHATKRIDLAHQMALADAADRRVAAHGADAVKTVSQEDGGRARPRRRAGRLDAGMPAADHHDVGLDKGRKLAHGVG